MPGAVRGRRLLVAAATAVAFVATLFPGAAPVAAAAGASLRFSVPPGGGPAFVPWPTQPVVQIVDSTGSVVTSGADASLAVTLTLGSNPGGATLTCAGGTTVTASAGVATFAGCSLDASGSGYTVVASATSSIGPLSVTSSSFNMTAGPSQLVFSTPPGGGVVAVAWPTQPVVQVRDMRGNPVTTGPDATAQITLSLATNPGSGVLSCTGGLTKAAVAGVASFTGCKIDKPGSGYSILATGTGGSGSAGVTGVTSSPFTVTTGNPASLIFSIQPGGGAAGSVWASQPQITIRDSLGFTVTSSNALVSLTVFANPGGGTLTCSGGTSMNAVAGVATFSGCSIDRAGTGYTITASVSGVPSVTSAAFPINQGPPASIVFTTQPSATAAVNTAFGTQPVITIRDATGSTVTSSTAPVTLSVSGGAPGASLSCTGGVTKNAVAGIASFAGCKIDTVGSGFVLNATVGTLSATSIAITVTPGAPAKLAMTTQPAIGAVGTPLVPQPVVTIQDAAGNTVTTSSLNVTLAMATNPTSAVLSCSGGLTRTAVAGVATFSGCSISKIGSGYTIRASSGSLTAATSASFNVTAGTPDHVAFTTQPTGAAAASMFPQQPVVTIMDVAGNTVSSSTAQVTLTITPLTGTSGATLTCSGGTTVSAIGGIASFSGCSINRAGAGYTLTASSAGIASATSAALTITAGAATHLGYISAPGDTAVGLPLSPQPVVSILDAAGSVVTTGSGATTTVTLALGVNPTGATLTCSGGLTKNAVAGVATFSGCMISKVGYGFTITAVASGLQGVSSPAFDMVPGAPYQAGFLTQPGGAAYGMPFSPQPAVAIQDAGGNIVTSSTAQVILAITPGTAPAGAVLSCSGGVARSAVNGIATFSGCSIDRAAPGVTLTATSVGVLNATSTPFTVSAGSPTHVQFTTQPVPASAGTAFTTQPIVKVLDAAGNVVTGSYALVTLSLTPGTGPAGASLTCTSPTVAASNGVATFAGCTIDKVGSGYTLTASSTLLTSDTSVSLTVLAGPAAKLAFSVSPDGASLGVAFTTQPRVVVQDAGGNTSTVSTTSVTLSILAGTGTAGATLTCIGGLSKNASAGIATYSGCAVSKAGTGYQLKTTAGSLIAGISDPFDVAAGPPSKLAFGTQPVGSAAGTPFATQPVVKVQDSGGNTATTGTVSVTLALGANTAGGTLTCSGGLTKTAVAGVATFDGCTIDKMGSGYTLVATATGLAAATSTPFAMTVGAAAKLIFDKQPNGGAAAKAWTAQPVIKIVDAAGSVVATGTAATLNVTLAITASTGTSGAALTCTGGLSKKAASGVASFSGCAIDKAGADYTLTATATGLTSATSDKFTVTAGAPAKLLWTTQPGGGTTGSPWTAQPVLTIQDAGGTTVTTSTASVTLSITSGTGATGAKLTCTGSLSKAAVAGVVTFAGCAIDTAGTGYTLTAKMTGVTSDPSTAFAITQGASTGPVAFTTQPGGGKSSTAWTTQPVVTIRDASGATVTTGTNATANVTLSITANTGTAGAKLACTSGLSKAAVAGVAAFSGCQIDKDGTGYTLTATVTGLTPGTSATFSIGTNVNPPATGPLTLTRSTSTVNWGKSVVLTVQVSGDGTGRPVVIEVSADRRIWTTLATLTPDAAGKATLSYRPTGLMYFRARESATGTKSALVTAVLAVAVRQTIVLRPTTLGGVKALSRGISVTFTGTARPIGKAIPRTKVQFAVYRKVGSTWVYVTGRTVAANSAGVAKFKYTFAKTGTWAVRARACSTKLFTASAWSGYTAYSVR